MKTSEAMDEFPSCSSCGSDMEFVDCWSCGGEEFIDHDCGEDTCCCADPEPNVRCDFCDSNGGWWLCLARCEASKGQTPDTGKVP